MTERMRNILRGFGIAPKSADELALVAAMQEMAEAVELPSVSSADNGSIFGVKNGAWTKDTNTFVLSGTIGQNEQEKGTMTFEETAAELYSLCATGRKCKLVFDVSGTPMEVFCDVSAIKDGNGNSAKYAFIVETTSVYAVANLSGTDAVVLTEQ